MVATALKSSRFVRRTRLNSNEYRRNFHQIDHDVLAAVTSEEATRVTPLMSKIYLRLVGAPASFWEREGVLYFSAGEEKGLPVKASKVLYGLLGVASATAHKALGWMHEQGIIGYYAGKNGAGIRIFLNRATNSIGLRPAAADKKILPFARGSNGVKRGSTDEPAFNDSFAVLEVPEIDLIPPAPKSSAENTPTAKKYPEPQTISDSTTSHSADESKDVPARPPFQAEIPMDEIVSRLSRKLEPTLQAAAERAAAREHERTREWLENKGLPKAARVAQHEAYKVLRRYGAFDDRAESSSKRAEVGRGAGARFEPKPLSAEEVTEFAHACVAMLEVHGRPIEFTLSEMSAENGGFLLLTDAVKVREMAEAILSRGLS